MFKAALAVLVLGSFPIVSSAQVLEAVMFKRNYNNIGINQEISIEGKTVRNLYDETWYMQQKEKNVLDRNGEVLGVKVTAKITCYKMRKEINHFTGNYRCTITP